MKTIVNAFVALAVIAGVAGSAQAFDARSLFTQLERDGK